MIKDIITANELATPNQKEINILKENFPSCFRTDGTFDMVRFSEFLKDKIDISHEGYELKFLGKNYAKMLASLDTETVIVPDEAHNSLPENKNSENVYISGDNLDGLKHLLKSYAGQVKCIYIDPPYNTGSDGFVYNDKFNFTAEDLIEKLSIDEEQAQRILDLTNRGSASHSAWLMFMYPRLQLARDLLDKDGVIFISIDENEQANCKLICDDIFGENNCLANLVWRKKYTGGKGTSSFADYHEYILAYSRNQESLGDVSMARPDDEKKKFIYEDEYIEERGRYYTRPLKSNLDPRPTLVYPITLPDGSTITTQWICAKDTYEELLSEGRIEFKDPNTSDWPVYKKFYEFDGNGEVKIPSFLEISNNNEAKSELKKLFNIYQTRDLPFQTPKPTKLLQLFVDNFVNDGDIILDFFSGSASTSHAVMKSSVEKNKNIKYIVIQLQENLDDNYLKASGSDKAKIKKAIEFLDSVYRNHTIDQIGIERIIRAAKQLKENNPETKADLGFKHYTLSDVSQNTLDKIEKFDNSGFITNTSVYDEFGTNTILTTWLVHDNYGFVNNCEMIDLAGHTAYWCENHLYLINPGLSEDAIKALVEKYNTEGAFNPQNIVLFGYSFNYVEMENLKTNVKILRDSEKNLKINLDIRY
jgi:site-specific DNA-methyltransferase (adenine-specific)